MNKSAKAFQKKQKIDWDYIKTLIEESKTNPNYYDYCITIDAMHDSSYYESGTLISISSNRKGFDNLHENYGYLYRGGYEEIKVGDDYIIYGFNFD